MKTFNLEFTEDEIQKAVADSRLLSMEIEFSRRCNFRCSYCYVPSKEELADELSRAELKDAIGQAKELGAGKIIILGGEPSIYPHLEEMISFIKGEGLEAEMFTNGSGITPEMACFLAGNKVRVVLKQNSQDEEIQDRLAGKTGAFQIIKTALNNLRQAGYPAADKFLAVSTIICRQNIAELPEMWQWLRNQDIEPYFEVITPQGNAKQNAWLEVPSDELRKIFSELAQIDKKKYGREWEPQPPLAGNRCMRHQVSCVVTSTGNVMPCVGVTIAIGNIREQPLAEIIKNSEVINNLKNFRQTIKGACRTCDKASECYGCRGAAYQLTGDYLEADPTCWLNSSCKKG
ncbi:radical SAM/SPASM domain-containing protein [Desulfobacterota bacterium M19]